MFYQYFTNGCGNQAMEHGVVREHMYEMETEASENIPMSRVAQPKKIGRGFFVLHWYFARFVSHRNIITVSLITLDTYHKHDFLTAQLHTLLFLVPI